MQAHPLPIPVHPPFAHSAASISQSSAGIPHPMLGPDIVKLCQNFLLLNVS